jgi:hypothetical protein
MCFFLMSSMTVARALVPKMIFCWDEMTFSSCLKEFDNLCKGLTPTLATRGSSARGQCRALYSPVKAFNEESNHSTKDRPGKFRYSFHEFRGLAVVECAVCRGASQGRPATTSSQSAMAFRRAVSRSADWMVGFCTRQQNKSPSSRAMYIATVSHNPIQHNATPSDFPPPHSSSTIYGPSPFWSSCRTLGNKSR